MIDTQWLWLILLGQLILLYFFAQTSLNELFYFFKRVFRNDSLVFTIISILFLPGTIVHELSHFFMAMILFLKVKDITIFPKWQENTIKLGSVTYIKRDPIRGLIVGIAPVIVGILFFLWLGTLQLQFSFNNLYSYGLLYVIFVVSSTMFSSKQDLVDLGIALPISILVGIIFFFVGNQYFNSFIDILLSVENVSPVLYPINWYIFYSLLIHLALISILRVIRLFLKS
jgi:hypothetical protein